MEKLTNITLFFILSVFSSLCLGGGDHKIFDLGDFTLDSGAVLPSAKLSYVTHGQLNADRCRRVSSV